MILLLLSTLSFHKSNLLLKHLRNRLGQCGIGLAVFNNFNVGKQ